MVSTPMRNARKRTAKNSKAARPVVPALPAKSKNQRHALSSLHSAAVAGQQRPEALGVDYMEIPCSLAKPDRVAPLYLVEENALGGPENGVWQCVDCMHVFHNRRSWQKHKGINWIHASGVEVCTA